MNDVSILRPASSVDLPEEEKIDLWLWPEGLPHNIAIINRRPNSRYWRFSLEEIRLLPAPTISITELCETYADEPVMGWHQLQWFLANQAQIPESWREFTIYFLGFTVVRKPWVRFLYVMKYEQKKSPEDQFIKGSWVHSEERFDNRPVLGKGKIILSR